LWCPWTKKWGEKSGRKKLETLRRKTKRENLADRLALCCCFVIQLRMASNLLSGNGMQAISSTAARGVMIGANIDRRDPALSLAS
jgi:hypothetical protein